MNEDLLTLEEAQKRGFISQPLMDDKAALRALMGLDASPAAQGAGPSLDQGQQVALLNKPTKEYLTPVGLKYRESDEQKTTESSKLSKEQADQLKKEAQESSLNISDNIKEAKKVLEDQLLKFDNLAKAEKENNQKKIDKAYSDLEGAQNKQPTMGEMVAQLLIGLAPTALGYAASNAVGISRAAGASAGAQAGIAGVKTAQSEFEKQKERAIESATMAYKAALEKGKNKENAYNDFVKTIEKEIASLPATEVKARAQLEMMMPEYFRKLAEAQVGKTTDKKGSKEGEKDTLPKVPSPPKPSSSKKEEEKLSPDLGYGFRMKPGFSKQDRLSAQKLVSKYGSVKPLFDDLEGSLETANFKSITNWTEAGENLRAKAMALQSALISFTERGASLTGTEKDLVESLGMRLDSSGKTIEKFKVAFNPKQIAQRLKSVENLLARQTSGRLAPYMAERVEPQVMKDRIQQGNIFRWDATTKQYKFLKKAGQ